MAAKHWWIGLALSLALADCHAQSITMDDERSFQITSLESLRGFQPQQSDRTYTVLDKAAYQRTVQNARGEINHLLTQLKPHRDANWNDQIALIVAQLIDKPYLATNGMGEGDWVPGSYTYQPSAVHIKQHPVYRLDQFDCQTLVQIVMALLHAHTLDEFDKTILSIAYGAAGNPNGNIVRYYNRNHFVDADFNSINQQHGWLQDISTQKPFAAISKSQTVKITRNKWFEKQTFNLEDNVHVLANKDGEPMANRFRSLYRELPFPHFDLQTIQVNYLPKSQLIKQNRDGRFIANQDLFNRIPTPAIIENVRDVNRWQIFGRKIKDMIGSELSISHMGILYRHTFNKGDIIHYKTECSHENKQTACQVTPVVCQQSQCRELMIAHATNNFPRHFLWYKLSNGRYTCSPIPPKAGISYTPCDRVITQPFFDYLTDKQFGEFWMAMPSFLGVHIETLVVS